MEKKKIESYKDLDVYQRAYKSCIIVMKEVVPKLPPSEKYDLQDQLSRSSKAVPRLIGEGFAKKYQKAGFQKYLFDASGETNETQVGLCQCRDIYGHLMDLVVVNDLLKEYEIIGKQIFKLREA